MLVVAEEGGGSYRRGEAGGLLSEVRKGQWLFYRGRKRQARFRGRSGMSSTREDLLLGGGKGDVTFSLNEGPY